LTDAVDKVGDEQRTGNNRIQVPRSLNECCAPDSYLETMLLTRPSKNVYRQHRPKTDVSTGNFVLPCCHQDTFADKK
jgi:hypothetical protein